MTLVLSQERRRPRSRLLQSNPRRLRLRWAARIQLQFLSCSYGLAFAYPNARNYFQVSRATSAGRSENCGPTEPTLDWATLCRDSSQTRAPRHDANFPIGALVAEVRHHAAANVRCEFQERFPDHSVTRGCAPEGERNLAGWGRGLLFVTSVVCTECGRHGTASARGWC